MSSSDTSSLQDRLILIGERSWVIASTLAGQCEARGAKVLMAKNSGSDLAITPHLAAAVLGSHSRDLCQQLQARAIPFVLYTGCIDHECSAAAIIQMPAPLVEVVARVEELLTRRP